jgi:hypothetical protein
MSMSSHKLSDAEKERYRAAGYANLERAGGFFHRGQNFIELMAPPEPRLVKTLVHEVGHRYWYKNLTQEQRARFGIAVKTKSPAFGRGMDREHEKFEESEIFPLKAKIRALRHGDQEKAKAWLVGWARPRWGAADISKGLIAWRDPDTDPYLKRQYVKVMQAVSKLAEYLRPLEDVEQGAPPPGEKDPRRWAAYMQNGLELVESIQWAAQQYFEMVPGTVDPVTDYGRTNPDEAFAEAFAFYVLNKPMEQNQIESLRAVLANRVAPGDVVEGVVEDGVRALAR